MSVYQLEHNNHRKEKLQLALHDLFLLLNEHFKALSGLKMLQYDENNKEIANILFNIV